MEDEASDGGGTLNDVSHRVLIVRAGLPTADTQYLLALLANAHPVLEAAIDLYTESVAAATAAPDANEPDSAPVATDGTALVTATNELNDTLSRIGARWRESSGLLSSLTTIINEYPHVFSALLSSDSDINLLHSLCYGVDPTLQHAHNKFIAIAQHSLAGDDSDSDDESGYGSDSAADADGESDTPSGGDRSSARHASASANAGVPFAVRQLAAGIDFVLRREREEASYRQRTAARRYVRQIADRHTGSKQSAESESGFVSPAGVLYLRSVLGMGHTIAPVEQLHDDPILPPIGSAFGGGSGPVSPNRVSGGGGGVPTDSDSDDTSEGDNDVSSDGVGTGVDTTAATVAPSSSAGGGGAGEADRRSIVSFQSGTGTHMSSTAGTTGTNNTRPPARPGSARAARNNANAVATANALLEAFAAYELIGDERWLHQTVFDVSRRWRDAVPSLHRDILSLFDRLTSASSATLTPAMLDVLEVCVYSDDTVLTSAYELYADTVFAASQPNLYPSGDASGVVSGGAVNDPPSRSSQSIPNSPNLSIVDRTSTQSLDGSSATGFNANAANERYSGLSNLGESVAWTELWDTVVRVIVRRLPEAAAALSTQLSHVTGTVQQLADEDLMGPTDCQYMLDVLSTRADGRPLSTRAECDIAHARAASNGGSSAEPAATALVIQAAFYQYLQRNPTAPEAAVEEWHNTILHVAGRWRRHSPRRPLLEHINSLSAVNANDTLANGEDEDSDDDADRSHLLLQDERDVLDSLAYEGDKQLLRAWADFERSDRRDSKRLWRALTTRLDDQFDAHATASANAVIALVYSLRARRLVPFADYLYLCSCIEQRDTALFAAACGSGSADADSTAGPLISSSASAVLDISSYPEYLAHSPVNELVDTITRIGARWRRTASVAASAGLSALSYTLALVDLIREVSAGALSDIERELLDALAYSQTESLTYVYAEYENASILDSAGGGHPLTGADSFDWDRFELTRRARFLDAIVAVLYEHLRVVFLDFMSTNDDVPLSTTGTAHLNRLFESHDADLLEAITEFAVSGQLQTFQASIWTISESWINTLDTSQTVVLQLLRESLPSDSLSPTAIDGLEFMLYRGDTVLMAAYELYAESGFSQFGWIEMWETLSTLVRRRLHVPMRSSLDNLLHSLTTLQQHGMFDMLPAGSGERQHSDAAYNYVCAAATAGSSVALEASFASYQHDPTSQSCWDEFVDTSQRVAAEWRRAHAFADVLTLIQTLRHTVPVGAGGRPSPLTAVEAYRIERELIAEGSGESSNDALLHIVQSWAQRAHIDPAYAEQEFFAALCEWLETDFDRAAAAKYAVRARQFYSELREVAVSAAALAHSTDMGGDDGAGLLEAAAAAAGGGQLARALMDAGVHIPRRLLHLSSADWRHLSSLIAEHDPTLMAIVAETRSVHSRAVTQSDESGDAIDATASVLVTCHDTVDSLIRMARSWRRTYSYPVALRFLHDLHASEDVADTLQLLAYEENAELLTALDQAITRRSIAIASGAGTGGIGADTALASTIERLVDRVTTDRHSRALQTARVTVQSMLDEPDRTALYRCSTAGFQYLTSLIEQRDWRVIRPFLAHSADAPALLEADESPAADSAPVPVHAIHALIAVSSGWKDELMPSDRDLLQLIQEMETETIINAAIADGLESLVYDQYEPLLAAFELYTAAMRDANEESAFRRANPPPLDELGMAVVDPESGRKLSMEQIHALDEAAVARAHDQAWAEFWDTAAVIVKRQCGGIELQTQHTYLCQLLRSMHQERVLSAVETNYLLHLVTGRQSRRATRDAAGVSSSSTSAFDVSAGLALQAAYQLYSGDDEGAAMPDAEAGTGGNLAEFTHTLQSIVRRWRRQHPLAALLTYIRSLHEHEHAFLTFEERDCLERCAVDKRDPELLTAASLAFDADGNFTNEELLSRASPLTARNYTRSSTDERGALASGDPFVAGALFRSVMNVLRRELRVVWQHLSRVGKQRVRELRRTDLMPYADSLFVHDLLNAFVDEPALDWYRVDSTGSAPHRMSQVVYAALAERYFTAGTSTTEPAEANGPADVDAADAELNDTLIRVGAKWRTVDAGTPDSTRRGLLELLGFFQDANETEAGRHSTAYPHFLRTELEVLEALVYREHAGLYSVYQNGFVASDVGNAARSLDRLADGMRAVLDSQYDEDCIRHTRLAAQYIHELRRTGKTTPTQHAHLSTLLGQTDPALLAAFAVYEDSGDVNELVDTVLRLSNSWLTSSASSSSSRGSIRDDPETDRLLLALIQSLVDNGTLTHPAVCDRLEFAVYEQDPSLFAGYAVYHDAGYTRVAWIEFWDTLRHLLEKWFMPLARNAPQQPNATAAAVDPSLAGMKFIESPLVQFGYCIDALYHNQQTQRHRPLSAAGYKYLKDLLKSGDVVLEAAFYEFRDQQNQDTGAPAAGAGSDEAAPVAGSDEFNDTLLHLATRWKRELSEADKELASYVDMLALAGYVTHTEYEYLEVLVYLRKPVLYNAFRAAKEQAAAAAASASAAASLASTPTGVSALPTAVRNRATTFAAAAAGGGDANANATSPALNGESSATVVGGTVLVLDAVAEAGRPAQSSTPPAGADDNAAGSRRESGENAGISSVAAAAAAAARVRKVSTASSGEYDALGRRVSTSSGGMSVITTVQDEIEENLFRVITGVLDRRFQRVAAGFATQAVAFIDSLKLKYSLQLPTSMHLYLLDCAASYDEVLFACFAESTRTQDVTELVDSLLRLGARWKKQHPNPDLLNLLHRLPEVITAANQHLAAALAQAASPTAVTANGVSPSPSNSKQPRRFYQFNATDYDALEAAAYQLHPALMNAYRAWEESGTAASTGSAANDSELAMSGLREFLHACEQLLAREQSARFERWSGRARSAIDTLLNEKAIGTAAGEYLMRLADTHDTVLMVAIAEYEETKNSDDLMEVLLRLATRWKRSSAEMLELTSTISVFIADHQLTSSLGDGMELLAYRRDTDLMSAYHAFVRSSRFELIELWSSLIRIAHGLTRNERERDDANWHAIVRMQTSGLLTRTDVRYLRDLLSINDIVLDDAFALYRAGVRSWADTCSIVCGLAKRWTAAASDGGCATNGDRLLLRLLSSFAADKVIDAEQLDTLQTLVYDGTDPTLNAAFITLTESIEETNALSAFIETLMHLLKTLPHTSSPTSASATAAAP